MARKKKKKELNPQELIKMESHHDKKRIRQMEIDAIKKDVLILKLKKEAYELTTRLQLVEASNKIQALQQRDAEINREHVKFVERIKEEAGIEGNLGYCPDTGDLKLD